MEELVQQEEAAAEAAECGSAGDEGPPLQPAAFVDNGNGEPAGGSREPQAADTDCEGHGAAEAAEALESEAGPEADHESVDFELDPPLAGHGTCQEAELVGAELDLVADLDLVLPAPEDLLDGSAAGCGEQRLLVDGAAGGGVDANSAERDGSEEDDPASGQQGLAGPERAAERSMGAADHAAEAEAADSLVLHGSPGGDALAQPHGGCCCCCRPRGLRRGRAGQALGLVPPIAIPSAPPCC